ncbi:N-acetylglucosamine-6-phosphate deacetylase [Pseudaminobacter sp. 19-2017]|uniref:N-acetylglucosamine-6-phosphate deacetylase n=1 Tax=Pseudaminobacter soli (ex Zhang et al. 2022) TaxID=2831468 RepID=A0A942DYE4_9HYPH|nr:N-acetylglucosamine-6-phosphate deacetylase [Pseudaminobacter soli]MBS3647768.1 N-acetylglucosamine-6-phosphate deacetylase [Pseudaminobacter soli]
MMARFALAAPKIFDGEEWHEDSALLVADGSVQAVVPRAELAAGTPVEEHDGMLVPGFVDLQVNGGGGVMLNDRQDAEAIRTICAAHARFGTTALLPTLITDRPEVTGRAIEAGVAAARERVPGFAGLHLEGPHLSLARKGAHDPGLIRPMTQTGQDLLLKARSRLPALLTTIAPESVSPSQVSALAAAGIVVSLGHSDTTYETALAYAEAGATVATHLFNAMSQIGNREPGLAGAAIGSGKLWAGLIADGVHVHPTTIDIALRAKSGPAKIFLVTDAMSTIGTDMTSFTLNGRTIRRENGRLTLEGGTLAGADLDMISAVRLVQREVGVSLGEALRMASLYPAQALGVDDRHGRLRRGSRADVVCLSAGLDVRKVWIEGEPAFEAG